jgi:uncharacterized damage-inducible protein DinB
MTLSEMILPEFDQEMTNTRKLLERVPEDKMAWKPHEKSMAMGRLASHVAELAGWATTTINQDSLNLTPDMKGFQAASRKELLETFDKNAAEARQAIAGASDAHLQKTWTLAVNGKTFFSMPRTAVLRGFVMNHLIHHRAQLGVYCRLNDVPIPGMYGPSADDAKMFS